MLFKTAFLGAAACAGLFATQAGAAVITVDLTGNVADFQPYAVDCCGAHYDQFVLPLSGVSPFTLAQDDTIQATVTLDQLYTIPASGSHTDFLLLFGGDVTGNTGADGEFNLYNGATLVATYDYSSTTSGQISSYAAIFPPDNGPITFDSFTASVHVNALDAPSEIDDATFYYALVQDTPLPEPATWAMMIAGFGLAGAGLRASPRKLALRFG